MRDELNLQTGCGTSSGKLLQSLIMRETLEDNETNALDVQAPVKHPCDSSHPYLRRVRFTIPNITHLCHYPWLFLIFKARSIPFLLLTQSNLVTSKCVRRSPLSISRSFPSFLSLVFFLCLSSLLVTLFVRSVRPHSLTSWDFASYQNICTSKCFWSTASK